MAAPKQIFPTVLFLFQALLIVLFALYAEYDTDISMNSIYGKYQDIHVMIFFGIGALLMFLRKYGYSGVSYNLLLGAVSVQWGTLLNAWISQRVKVEEGHEIKGTVGTVKISVDAMMKGDFSAATVLISFCTILGKASRMQLLIMAMLEPIFYAVCETVIVEFLHTADVGGSVVIHLFAAYFGLAVAAVIQNQGEDDHEDESSVYHSDLFSIIGTLFLWVYWPSFNAVPLPVGTHQENRAMTNTYYSMSACVVTTFFVSTVVNKNFKLNMVHIQNASLAGGVAVGSAANLMIGPWAALLTGAMAGLVSSLGFSYLTPFMNKKLRIHDTCGVHNLHGLPGILAGTVGTIAAAVLDKDDYDINVLVNKQKTVINEYDLIYVKGTSRGTSKQAGYQFASIWVGFTMAIASGLITGAVMKYFDDRKDKEPFNDQEEFEVPHLPDKNYNYNGNIELTAVKSV